MKILIIEDDKLKAEEVINFVETNFSGKCSIDLCDSYRSGLRRIMKEKFDLLLLDMSLPTRSTSNSSNQGYERFGGYAILNEMKRKKKTIPTILITMYKEFGGKGNFIDLKTLSNLCKDSFDPFFIDSVFYSSGEDGWKEKLITFINKLNEDINR